jgi:predicted RNase H-like nuclease
MTMRGPTRGARLPYHLIAGVVPCSPGWLVASAKVQGATLAPEDPQVMAVFTEVLDYKPAYEVIALFSPVGLPDEVAPHGRSCEEEARKLLGLPRSSTIVSTPPRAVLSQPTYEQAVASSEDTLNPIRWRQRRRILEVDDTIAPYWQRKVFEVHPELSYFQLNEDASVKFSKRSFVGGEERRILLERRLPGVERILDASLRGVRWHQLLDAAACLWTARRIMARAVSRLPEHPEWNSAGLRMEMVR